MGLYSYNANSLKIAVVAYFLFLSPSTENSVKHTAKDQKWWWNNSVYSPAGEINHVHKYRTIIQTVTILLHVVNTTAANSHWTEKGGQNIWMGLVVQKDLGERWKKQIKKTMGGGAERIVQGKVNRPGAKLRSSSRGWVHSGPFAEEIEWVKSGSKNFI